MKMVEHIMDPKVRFLKAYIKSMQLYYSFVTGIAGWECLFMNI